MTQLPPGQPATDADLVSRVAGGDAGAFGELYRRRRGDVFRFALHMTGSRAVAEDVAQDVFVAVIGSAARYDPSRAAVATWLCGMARNHIRQRRDRDRPFQPLSSLAGDTRGEPAVLPDPLGDLARVEGIERLRRVILTLPAKYREAVALCDLQEMSYAEAAAVMRCRVGTVRSRLHRGRELLAARLGAEQGREQAAAVHDARCTA